MSLPSASPSVSTQKTSVLGLESEPADEAVAETLTQALRKIFAERGFPLGESLGIAELRLLMGCNGNDATCLARGGESMAVEQLVYGRVYVKDGRGYVVDVSVLDVKAGKVIKTTDRTLRPNELGTETLNQVARSIVDELFAPAENKQPTPVAAPTAVTENAEHTPPANRTTRYEWGPYQNRPRWKWAGFGVGVTLTVAGAAGALFTGLSLRNRLRDELEAAATAEEEAFPFRTLDDGSDWCDQATQTLVTGVNAGVRNGEATRVCLEADIYRQLNWASFGVLAAGAVTTAVFTTLLFVHKKRPGSQASRHQFQLGAGPHRDGAIVTGSMRF